MRIFATLGIAAALTTCAAAKEDPLVGVFESESRENFGSSIPGEWRVEISSTAKGKYVYSLSREGKLLETLSVIPCSEESEDYLRGRPSGRASLLCMDAGMGTLHGVFAYVENGIVVPSIRTKHLSDPNLLKGESLKPGDPALFEARLHKAKYYGHVQWAFYGFRRIEK